MLNFSRATRPAVFDIRSRSLLRGTGLVLLSLLVSFRLAHFPQARPTLWLMIPAFVALLGTWDTTRCLRIRWSWYHGGVLLFLYMDILALSMIFFLLLYPYAGWLL